MPKLKRATASLSHTPLQTNTSDNQFNELLKCPFWSKWTVLNADHHQSTPLFHMDAFIDKVDVSSKDERLFLVTSSGKANLYRWPENKSAFYQPELYASFHLSSNKIYRKAYGGVIRSTDGELVALGCDDSKCRLYSVKEGVQRSCLRELKDVTFRSELHCCQFLHDTQVLTAYDNGHVRTFDIATGTVVQHANDVHKAQIRALDVCGDMTLMGSFDRSATLMDVRMLGHSSGIITRFEDANEPIISVALDSFGNRTESLDSVGMIALATGQHVKIFDTRKTNEVLFDLCAHYGTVLSIENCKFRDSMNVRDSSSYLLAAGMDKLVQTYDLHTGQHVHSEKCDRPISAIAIRKENPNYMVIATDDGTFQLLVSPSSRVNILDDDVNEIIPKRDRFHETKMRPFERKLQKFNVYDAMDQVLCENVSLEDMVDMFNELIVRGQLQHALKGRDIDRLIERLCDAFECLPGRFEILLSVANAIIYHLTGNYAQITQTSLQMLKRTIDVEINLQKTLLGLQGLHDVKILQERQIHNKSVARDVS